MKMAKATKNDFRVIRELFQTLEDMDEVPHDSECYASKVLSAWSKARCSWGRVVFGCEMLIENCCDPASSTLEWKPEIEELQTDNERLKTALEKIVALEGCECDGYHNHKCLMCKVREIARNATRPLE